MQQAAGWRPGPGNPPQPGSAGGEGRGSVPGMGVASRARPACCGDDAAPGGLQAEWLETVTVLDPAAGGEPSRSKASELQFAYSPSRLQLEPLLVLSVCFRLSAATIAARCSRRTTPILAEPNQQSAYHQPAAACFPDNPEPLKARPADRGFSAQGPGCRGAMVSPLACQLHRQQPARQGLGQISTR